MALESTRIFYNFRFQPFCAVSQQNPYRSLSAHFFIILPNPVTVKQRSVYFNISAFPVLDASRRGIYGP